MVRGAWCVVRGAQNAAGRVSLLSSATNDEHYLMPLTGQRAVQHAAEQHVFGFKLALDSQGRRNIEVLHWQQVGH